jgi:hypothetical protein
MNPVEDAIITARREGNARAVMHLLQNNYKPTAAEWRKLAALPVNGGNFQRDEDGLTPRDREWIAAAKLFRELTTGGKSDDEAQAQVCAELSLDWEAFDRVLTGRTELIRILRPLRLWPLRGFANTDACNAHGRASAK